MKPIIAVAIVLLIALAGGTYHVAMQRPSTCSTLNERFVWGDLS